MNAGITIRLPALLKSQDDEPPANALSVPSQIATEVSDEALLALVCEKDSEALAVLFRRYARIVRGVAYRVLRDASEADDLLQDIFVLIHRLCNAFDSSRGSARFWILQMTYCRALSRRRYLTSRHFYTRLELDEAVEAYGSTFTAPGQVQSSIDEICGNEGLEKILETLSDKQRQTLRLFFVEGYTFDEIAVKFGETPGNVRHHYYRGLEKLRKRIFAGKLPSKETV